MPGFNGDAIHLDNNALGKGFLVTNVPQARAMIVFNKGKGNAGHVGWVTGISLVENRIKIEYTDMNGGNVPPDRNVWRNQAAGITSAFEKFVEGRSTSWDPAGQAFIVAPVELP